MTCGGCEILVDPNSAEGYCTLDHVNKLCDLHAHAAEYKALLAELVDPDDCWFDHHGYCQAHGWLQEGECPHARAKKALEHQQ